MGNGFRYRAERIALGAMAVAGIAVLIADLLGWLDKMAPGGALPKITLLILSTVTLFLLMEFERLKVLDTISTQMADLHVDGLGELRRGRFLGAVRVHEAFPHAPFLEMVRTARWEVSILQTWIPNLELFASELAKAITERRTEVRILLLRPSSLAAGLRHDALETGEPDREVMDVEGSLRLLKSVYDEVPPELRNKLQVKLYNSLPSIAVYKTDERYLVSSFLHGRLAIRSTQIEIDGSGTVMGQEVQGELDKLWNIGRDVDLRDWRMSIDSMD
ncbi:hypothetical protein [Streptomyces sp. NPDC088762]|uniref:hypothetical protein n=1 Tax=Streptomyces sp. NPDC088762 TaxID=3365891 RepID=UPI00381A572D